MNNFKNMKFRINSKTDIIIVENERLKSNFNELIKDFPYSIKNDINNITIIGVG